MSDQSIKLEPCRRCGGRGYITKIGVSNTPERYPCPACEERKVKLTKKLEEIGILPSKEESQAHKTLVSLMMLGKMFTAKEPK